MKVERMFLANTLRDMAAKVELGDSWEGSIEYSCLGIELETDEFEIQGAYRVGNSNGQGGMRVLK